MNVIQMAIAKGFGSAIKMEDLMAFLITRCLSFF